MVKVITYGTYDMFHYGHRRLLERAKALGDYLIVGVTSDDYDKTRGKINNQQSLAERIAAVKATGLADEIIVEEYVGQKIDDIRRYGVDIFTLGSDWEGKFDYLNEYCKVVYLPRTEGVSSTELRGNKRSLALGLVGSSAFIGKVEAESRYVNGIAVKGIYTEHPGTLAGSLKELELVTGSYDELLDAVDAVYIRSQPRDHYEQIAEALRRGKHVLCEAPLTLRENEWEELRALAEERGLILMDALKTAYSTAYSRLLLQVKSGCIGEVVSVDATCTSLRPESELAGGVEWDNIAAWGPTALLPIFQLLGTEYTRKRTAARFLDAEHEHDSFVKMDFVYPHAVASLKIGSGVKSEGELIISGTKGYIYVPAPWWKTDYFEMRFENQTENKRYFYQLDGEGIRYELVVFSKAVEAGRSIPYIMPEVSRSICRVMEDFTQRKEFYLL